MEYRTNKSTRNPEHTITLTPNQVKDVRSRFRFLRGKWKVVKLPGTNIDLHYKTIDGVVKVGFEERGYGVANDYYGIDEIK